MEPEEDPPLVVKLRSLLNRSTKIHITDGRVFVGQFMCIDNSKNIILSGAYESQPPSTSSAAPPTHKKQAVAEAAPVAIGIGAGADTTEQPKSLPSILKKRPKEEKRFVGQIMIPGHHIVKVEMDCSHLRGADSLFKPLSKYDMSYFRG